MPTRCAVLAPFCALSQHFLHGKTALPAVNIRLGQIEMLHPGADDVDHDHHPRVLRPAAATPQDR